MTSELCSTCKGRCCRDSYRYKLTHMGDEFYEHVCDACYDGTKHVPPRSPEDERADVVAWLREEAEAVMQTRFARRAGDFAHAADAIERGEHLSNSSGRVDS